MSDTIVSMTYFVTPNPINEMDVPACDILSTYVITMVLREVFRAFLKRTRSRPEQAWALRCRLARHRAPTARHMPPATYLCTCHPRFHKAQINGQTGRVGYQPTTYIAELTLDCGECGAQNIMLIWQPQAPFGALSGSNAKETSCHHCH